VEAARAYGAELLLLHVPPALPMDPAGMITPEAWARILADQRTAAERDLARLVSRARRSGARAAGVVANLGVIHEQIVRTARRRRAGLIVIGTHGRTGLQRALLGSVAARVIATAPCPVMTVHAPVPRRPGLAPAA
jgi:universal stress protein A